MILSDRTRTALLTIAAMVAFAANSVFARVALLMGTIDAASFTTVRLAAGAVTLILITGGTRGARSPASGARPSGSWKSAFMLFLYAAPFSFAYLRLSTGTGALILFGFVQITMILGALIAGERPSGIQWAGLLLAVLGLVYLMLPGITAPPFSSAALMALAGFSWGVYSLLGRGGADPLTRTTGNFARSVPFVVLLSVVMLPELYITMEGALLAVASGALASGLGYVVWYSALSGLTATKAAVVQLSVPVLAAAGGVALLSEPVTFRLSLAAAMILGGIGLAVARGTDEGGRATR